MGDCVQCHEPLMLKVEETPDEPGVPTASYANGHSHYLPDDVELACGCHFHWQCLIDNNQDKHCPKCGWDVTIPTTAGIQMLVNIDNEGGSKESENIYPLIVEENWCREHPQERICRAFLELCREGEMSAVAGLLSDCERRENTRRTRAAVRARDELPDAPEPEDEDDEDDEDDNVPGPTAAQIMRYQDPLGNMESGLHAAIANKNDEVAWLLLYLGTKLNYHEFPAVIFQETQNLGVQRQDQVDLVDIRALRDSEGRVPLQIAQEMGTYWRTWISSRRLVPAADPQGGYEGGGPA
ncbi:hypothetical protein B9Z65_5196 [Elsinoe australis]|uniref:Uncharacterized protein n=1 Tax=Elsinoe australis TaxID=40998 RepID=A0A2P7ZDE3_9PEZI|nr:hypothetical protein B9Z65_5196 [Elsinoe australis]